MGLVALSLGIAIASHRLIEYPVRFGDRFAAGTRRSLTVGLSLTVAAGLGAVALGLTANHQLDSSRQAMIVSARADLPRVYADGCHADTQDTLLRKCTYGDPRASRTMFLVGDSHAAQWFPPLDLIADRESWRLVSLTKGACPMADVTPITLFLKRPFTECAHWRAPVLRRIAAERPAIVILSDFTMYVFERGRGVTSAGWVAAMHRTLGTLRATGAHVVILHDTPQPSADLPECLARALMRGAVESSCDFALEREQDDSLAALDRAAAVGLDGVAVIDLTDQICPGALCPAIRNGGLTFRDQHHLSTQTSTELAPLLCSRLAATGWFPDCVTPSLVGGTHPIVYPRADSADVSPPSPDATESSAPRSTHG